RGVGPRQSASTRLARSPSSKSGCPASGHRASRPRTVYDPVFAGDSARGAERRRGRAARCRDADDRPRARRPASRGRQPARASTHAAIQSADAISGQPDEFAYGRHDAGLADAPGDRADDGAVQQTIQHPMTHDSRRYHRRRGPVGARAYGMLGALGGAASTAGSAVASGLESAAGAVGSGLESAAGSALGGAGKTALSGLESVGQGIQSLFSSAPTEAGRIAALGQTVPQGVELAGPGPPFQGPGVFPGAAPGLTDGPHQFRTAGAGPR